MQPVLDFLMSKTLTYLLSLVLGVFVNYMVASTNGRTQAVNFMQYLFKETPGATTATIIAIATAAGFVLTSNVLDSMAIWVVVNFGFWKGLGLDAAFPGGTSAGPAPAASTDILPAVVTAAPPSQKGFARVEVLALILFMATAVLALQGCGMFGDTKPVISGAPASCKSTDPQTKAVTVDSVCAEAFDVLNQANVLLIAVDKAATDRVNNQIWTREQALPYFRQTEAAAAKLDQAQLLFSAGTYTSAKAQAEAVNTGLLLLQKEIAAAAAKK